MLKKPEYGLACREPTVDLKTCRTLSLEEVSVAGAEVGDEEVRNICWEQLENCEYQVIRGVIVAFIGCGHGGAVCCRGKSLFIRDAR